MSNDPVLIKAAREGNEEALLLLLHDCQPDLRRIAQSQCSSSADADDATQESLWLVYKRIGALRATGSFGAWMFSIVRNECRRLMRKMRGRTELPAEDSRLFAYTPRPDLRVDLAAAISLLPPKYREAIVLRDVEEYSVADMANALRLTRAAVKSRIHRGRGMVREYLHD